MSEFLLSGNLIGAREYNTNTFDPMKLLFTLAILPPARARNARAAAFRAGAPKTETISMCLHLLPLV